MASELHEELCRTGEKWLKRNGFAVTGINIWASRSRERVDCIGFRASCSVVLESKVSRSDFFQDLKKPERHAGGAGTYRFYITPPGLISVDELPGNWGLLEAEGRRVTEIHAPKGNYWPSFEDAKEDTSQLYGWADFAHERDEVADRSLLFSVARRLAK